MASTTQCGRVDGREGSEHFSLLLSLRFSPARTARCRGTAVLHSSSFEERPLHRPGRRGERANRGGGRDEQGGRRSTLEDDATGDAALLHALVHVVDVVEVEDLELRLDLAADGKVKRLDGILAVADVRADDAQSLEAAGKERELVSK